jgi:hypothetical protein
MFTILADVEVLENEWDLMEFRSSHSTPWEAAAQILSWTYPYQRHIISVEKV